MGEKSVFTTDAIEMSKEQPLEELITALGIRFVGTKVIKNY